VLTRGHIVRWENLALPGGREPRGWLLAEIELDGARVAFASTHLSLRRDVRRGQLEMLVRELPSKLPLVLAGDMNCTAEELGPLRERFEIAPDVRTYPSLWPLRALDHVAVGPQLRIGDVRTARSHASDHLPLIAEITLA
jgi:endonuclease/exonuclease/phosphatase family metal-dependent hydrolase